MLNSYMQVLFKAGPDAEGGKGTMLPSNPKNSPPFPLKRGYFNAPVAYEIAKFYLVKPQNIQICVLKN